MLKPAALSLSFALLGGCVLQLPAPQQPPSPLPNQAKQPSQLKFGDEVPGGWLHVSTMDNNAYQVQAGSFRFDRDTDGKSLAVVIARSVDLSNQRIFIFQWSVATEDCISGRGTLLMHDMKGDLIGHNEFVFKGGNLGSNVAELICGVAVNEAGKQQRQPVKETKSPNRQPI